MSRFRKFVFFVLVLNVMVIAVHDPAQRLWASVNAKPLDDWKYQNPEIPKSPSNWETLKIAPFYVAGFWIGLEFLLLMLAGGWFGGFAVVVVTISVLASVAGPMIGSITDQGPPRDYGFSVGGAKDINNFRQNIALGHLPQPSDVTFEGLFYDYFFDVGKVAGEEGAGDSSKLFYPTYSCAVSKNPLTGETEKFLAVGLKSNIKIADFSRKKLNLVVVLDISGSMSSPFNNYYYDGTKKKKKVEGDEGAKTKLEVACRSINGLIDRLRADDRFGMVLYDHNAYLAKPVSLISETDILQLKKHILDLETKGATSMEEGLEMGTDLLRPFRTVDPKEYENRVIFLTDAMPNTDDTSESGLLGITRENAKNRIFFTFIGIGVDFNSQTIESITKVRGANYYSVHSPEDFKRRMADEFELMVTPMVFDLTLTLKSNGYKIEEVYGSPEADLTTGRVLQVRTLFPAKTTSEGTKGGLILIKLREIGEDKAISLRVNYEDREGKEAEVNGVVKFPGATEEYYDDSGIRKGVLLTRYAQLIKGSATGKWKRSIRSQTREGDGSGWSYWERSSTPLAVSSQFRPILRDFQDYFEKESEAVKDSDLNQELPILKKLADLAG